MIIQSKNVWINELLQPAQIEINEGKIVAINEYDSSKCDEDFGDRWILPGFIDVHTHGWNNCNSNTATIESMTAWSKHMPKEGVTSFLATTSTQSEENNLKTLSILKQYIEEQSGNSEILGINIEGNFISHECAGAQDRNYIVDPDVNVFDNYVRTSGNHIMTVTYAPEKDKDFAFVHYCAKHGIAASIGHSNCTFDQANQAIANGAKGITHTGNGMKPFHHRTPGLFGAAVTNNNVYCEVIGDGIHVAFATAQIIATMKGKNMAMLITDSAEQKDDPKYDYLNADGAYRLPDGTLFGSALYVNKGVYNLIYKSHLPLATAINAATINPATYLGVNNRKGSISINKDADIVVCDDQINLIKVYCKGIEQL